MRVMGVDPGLSRCGVGVIEGSVARPTVVRAGVIRTDVEAPVAQRLAVLYDELTQVIARDTPDAIAVERVFFNANVRTAMSVGQAAGVVLLCAAQAGVPITEYTPTQVKSSVAGYGSADKAQVAYMVRALLRLTEAPKPADTADALALALCHLQQGVQQGVMASTSVQAAAGTGPTRVPRRAPNRVPRSES